ncbi:TPA: hypothetical protein RHH95_003701 [Acinetobacter baumannii]|nr:hypothetical protein [Acinetobacter baumannii]
MRAVTSSSDHQNSSASDGASAPARSDADTPVQPSPRWHSVPGQTAQLLA